MLQESRDTFKDKLLTEMIGSINKHETREFRREGCLEGVEACRGLRTLEDFERALMERETKESGLRNSVNDGEISTEDYWRHRCATLQIEHVYERLKAFNVLKMPNTSEVVSARAVIQTARLLGGADPGSEFDSIREGE